MKIRWRLFGQRKRASLVNALLSYIVTAIQVLQAFVMIPLGLAILGLEYAWARRWLKKIRRHVSDTLARKRGESADERRGL